jgi:phosphoglycerate kinase
MNILKKDKKIEIRSEYKMKIFDKKSVKNKIILLRVDFNVDIDKKGNVLNSFRIESVLPTIKKILSYQPKAIVLISSRGRPKGKKDKNLSLFPISKYLEKKLKKEIVFIQNFLSEKSRKEIQNSEKGKIFLLENIRFWKEEEDNNIQFAKKLSQLGDIFVNDAFGVCHRSHSSIVGITKFLPSFSGILLKKEIQYLSKIKNNFRRPLVLILGGIKIKDKIPLLKHFSQKAKYILISGGLANTILFDLGFFIGKSIFEKGLSKEILKNRILEKKIFLPFDFLIGKSLRSKKSEVKEILELKKEDMILDIGPETIKGFNEIIKQAKTIIWNGPMGYFENPVFSQGTISIAKSILKNKKEIVVGGGDTIEALEKFNLIKYFDFVSTGGGAMLNFLSEKKLPGIEALN